MKAGEVAIKDAPVDRSSVLTIVGGERCVTAGGDAPPWRAAVASSQFQRTASVGRSTYCISFRISSRVSFLFSLFPPFEDNSQKDQYCLADKGTSENALGLETISRD